MNAAFASLSLAGCTPAIYHHYVKSARAETAAPLVLPAVNFSTGGGHHLLAARITQGSPARGLFRTRSNEYHHSSPDNYGLWREPTTVGFEYQSAFNPLVDFFLSFEGAPNSRQHGALMTGLGITFPFHWLGVRVAPALGPHTYTMATTDSIRSTRTGLSGGTYQSDYIKEYDGRRMGINRAVSVSAWLPRQATGLPITPLAQFQWTHLDMNSGTMLDDLPDEVLGLSAYTLGAGLDYAASWGHLRTRLWWENAGASGFASSYRADAGIAVRLGR